VIVFSQDTHFSQSFNSPLSLNPALTGAFDGGLRMLSSYRDQWRSITIPFRTYAFSSDIKMFKKLQKNGYLGVGISFISDKAGTSQLSSNIVNFSIAFHEQISLSNVLSAGIQGGIIQKSIDLTKSKWDNQYNGNAYDPTLPSFENQYLQSVVRSDFSAGIQWTYSKGELYAVAKNQLNINAGFALFHLTQPNISFNKTLTDRLPIKMVFHCNSQIGLGNSKVAILPMFIYTQQGTLKNALAGSMFRFILNEKTNDAGFVNGAALSCGALYRVDDAIIPMLQLEFANYAIGFSYDINNSDLKCASFGKGGYEISLRFLNPNPFSGKPITSKTPRYFN